MAPMKGLHLAEAYFTSVGLEMIEAQYPEYKSRIAAGLVGMGSECFGYDDDLSRDHDWGPGFCLWLEENDFRTFGAQLQRSYEALPTTFNGYQRWSSAWGGGRVGVMEIGTFYSSFIGLPGEPQTLLKWLVIPEENLAACTNGKVFYDPLGEFSAIRENIRKYYPEDVRLKKIAARCMAAAQSGQYNYARCLQRKDGYSAHYALVRFCEAALSLVFLLNRQYCPYYKWSRKAAEALPLLGADAARAVDGLVRNDNSRDKLTLIEKLCGQLIDVLKQHDLSDSSSDFLLEHGPRVQSRINDRGLRQLDIWYAGG
jgi:hypothetical protein